MYESARIILEDEKLRIFIKSFKAESTERRDALLRDLTNCVSFPFDHEPLSNYMADPYPDSPDFLPRNWKSRVKHIIKTPQGTSFFPARALKAIKTLD